jgi:prevent-host-death family protein
MEKPMQEVGAFEAKNTLGSLLDRVERGEEIIISRRGKPVARLVPSGSGIDPAAARTAAASLRALAREIQGPPMGWEELRAYRDEGRR